MPELVERFRREGEALRRLNHPNIVKVLAAVEETGQPYLVMEYVSGGSMATLLEQQPQLPLGRALAIALELADALSRAHHLDILHRDIKPANIFLAS
jgi:serine/threonine protein kinase